MNIFFSFPLFILFSLPLSFLSLYLQLSLIYPSSFPFPLSPLYPIPPISPIPFPYFLYVLSTIKTFFFPSPLPFPTVLILSYFSSFISVGAFHSFSFCPSKNNVPIFSPPSTGLPHISYSKNEIIYYIE